MVTIAKPAPKEKLILGYITGSQKLPWDIHYTKPGQFISGAITLARDEINNDPRWLPNHEIDFVIAETFGHEEYSIRETVGLMEKNISAFIGPQETCIHEGRITASFNYPMVTYVSIDAI